MRFPQLPGRFGDCSVCFDPFSATSLAIAGIATAAAGTGASLYAGSEAQAASRSAQADAQAAQSLGFNARMEAQRRQLAAQQAISTDASRRFTETQAAQQQAQTGALQERGQIIKGLNEQQAITANRANQVVQEGVDAADATRLQAAQRDQVAQQQALNTPVVQQVAASNPLGAAGTNSSVTREAMDRGREGAAGFVKQYGDTQAALGGYAAPVSLARNTATTIGTNLMPALAADQIVRSGAPAILAPSTTAYQQAGTYGGALQEANRQRAAGLTGIAGTQAQSSTDIANQGQANTTTAIQNNLVLEQQKAAQLAGLGQGLQSIGTAGLQFAGSQGAFNGVFGPATGPGTYSIGPGPGAIAAGTDRGSLGNFFSGIGNTVRSIG